MKRLFYYLLGGGHCTHCRTILFIGFWRARLLARCPTCEHLLVMKR